MELKSKLYALVNRYDTLIVFLVIECLALTAFSLADANIIFRYLAFLISFALIPFVIYFTPRKELLSFALFSIPLVVIAFLTSFSRFTLSMKFGALENLSVMLGTLAFFFLGFAVRKVKAFKIDIALLTIGASIALLVFMSLAYSVFKYGIFHASIYKNLVYYYQGRLFVVSDEIKWLLGFSFVEMSINYMSFFGTLISSALAGLLFLSPSREPRKFYLTLVIGLIGLASIVLVPNLNALYLLIPVAIFAVLYRFVSKREKVGNIVQYIFFAFLGIVGFALLIAILNASGVSFISDAIAVNAFTNRLFNTNRIMQPINEVLKMMFTIDGLFGYPTTYLEALVARTGAFEFEIIKEGGLFSFLAMIAFLILVFISLFRYSVKSKDHPFVKVIILSALIGAFLHSSFLWETFPQAHNDDIYFSFFRSAPFLIILFLIGYAYYPLKGEPAEIDQQQGIPLDQTVDVEEEIKL